MTRAVFLDRDGTLVEEVGYLDRLERLRLFPYSADAVRLLNRGRFRVVVVSNQSGIARGVVSEAFVAEAHVEIAHRLQAGGAHVDRFYYCPHHPASATDEYRGACACRKPEPGMLLQAAADLDIDLSRSIMVGDRWDDVAAGRAAGATSILVRTGYGAAAECTPRSGLCADVVADNLIAAAAWSLSR